MYMLRYKIPLEVILNKPIKKSGYEVNEVNMSDLKFNNINLDEIEKLGGQYDWIEVGLDGDRYKKMLGFNNEDVVMETIYDKGCYIITLVSERPFNTIVRNNRYCSSDGPWEEITLKEAIERFFEGCIYDGIGENPIGYIHYNFEELQVWLGRDLIEL